jgi:hypothetical protein
MCFANNVTHLAVLSGMLLAVSVRESENAFPASLTSAPAVSLKGANLKSAPQISLCFRNRNVISVLLSWL